MWLKLLALLATVIFLAASLVLLMALQNDFLTLSQMTNFIEQAYTNLNSRLIILYAGLGLLALGLFNVYLGFLSFRRKPLVIIPGPQGEIRIAYHTIESMVEKAGRDLGNIERIYTRIVPRRKKITLELRLSLAGQVNVVDLSHRLQELVRQQVEDVLGITSLGEVKITVRKVSLKGRRIEEDILEKRRTSRGIELHH